MMRTHTSLTAVILMALLSIGANAAAQSVDDVVALHLKARGGPEKWAAIQSQRVTGTVATSGVELSMTLFTARPNLMRQELTVEIPGQGPMAIYTVFDGSRALTINPMLGGPAPQELAGPEAQSVRDQSDFDGPLLGYKEKGHTVTLAGQETVAGRRAHRLEITRTGQPPVHYFIDAETGAELRLVMQGPTATTIDFSDHREVEGMLVPHRISVQAPTGPAEVTISSVELNVPTDPSMFTLP